MAYDNQRWVRITSDRGSEGTILKEIGLHNNLRQCSRLQVEDDVPAPVYELLQYNKMMKAK